ncbi:Arc family DNA-binding protein [Alicycliphilus denitrificans]|uniref:Arc family DNA-binding protein n=1 Tax=Alicycliphilus denitrificans TaxID=179636 RepID=UPI00384A68CF
MARPPKTTTAPTGSIAPFGLRMLPELKEKIEEAARANGRSMNAEITARLQQSFETDSAIEQVAFEHGFEATGLKLEIERLSKLLEAQKTRSQQELEAQSKALAAEALKHLYAEAGETIEAARRAAAELKAAGKWPIKRQPKS